MLILYVEGRGRRFVVCCLLFVVFVILNLFQNLSFNNASSLSFPYKILLITLTLVGFNKINLAKVSNFGKVKKVIESQNKNVIK